MFYDMEGNIIKFSSVPNEHILILGRSGMGKTFCLCREMEEAVNQGKSIIIFDYSGSYTMQELRRNRIHCMENVTILNPMDGCVKLKFRAENIESQVTNAIYKIVIKQGYHQKKLLREAVNMVFNKTGKFSILTLISILEYLAFLKDEDVEKENIYRLLSKLDFCEEIKNIEIYPCTKLDEKKPGICIIQLSDYSELQRKFCAEFLAEMFWQNIYHGVKIWDIFIMDEFQNMKLKSGSALSAMLREGRKYSLSVWLASQFLGNYDREIVDTLLQVGHKIFFGPNENDEKVIANLINQNHCMEWRKILQKLHVGEAVIKGRYFINKRKTEADTPIICKIVTDKDNCNNREKYDDLKPKLNAKN